MACKGEGCLGLDVQPLWGHLAALPHVDNTDLAIVVMTQMAMSFRPSCLGPALGTRSPCCPGVAGVPTAAPLSLQIHLLLGQSSLRESHSFFKDNTGKRRKETQRKMAAFLGSNQTLTRHFCKSAKQNCMKQ